MFAVLALCAALGSALGCKRTEGAAGKAHAAALPAPDKLSPEAKAEAAGLFRERCAKCHGPLGKGDGPDAHTLIPRPRNFSDPTWQLAVSDKHIDKIIQYGGASVGKSKQMPANPDLVNRPELLVALRQHVRILSEMP